MIAYPDFKDYLNRNLCPSGYSDERIQHAYLHPIQEKGRLIDEKQFDCTNVPRRLKHKFISIDSRDRDTGRYPNSNNFGIISIVLFLSKNE